MSASSILSKAQKEGRSSLLEPEALELCRSYEIPVCEWRFAENDDEAGSMAKELGFPIAMKVVTQQPEHKSSLGGVVLGLRNSKEVKSRYTKLMDSLKSEHADISILGAILQKQAATGFEVILSTFHDSQFGLCIMLGVGGILAQLNRKVVYGLIPLNEGDAKEMISEFSEQILGGPRADISQSRETLIRILLSLSRIMVEQEAVESVELNPAILSPDGPIVVDAKVFVRKWEC